MTDHPLVSVIIPTYRRNRQLVRAVESVQNQSYRNLEIIVVNDAPGNELPEKIIQNSEIKTISHDENNGGAAARNTGLDMAKGKYVAFLDDDDLFNTEKIEKQVRKMEKSSEDCFGCFTWHCFYSSEEDLKDGNGEVIEEDTDQILYRILRGFNIRVGGCSSLLIEREAVEEVGRFDERFPRHQDWELMVRLLEYGSIEVVEEPLFSKIGYEEPGAEKISEAKKLYMKKFNEKIDSLPEDKKNRVYRDNYSKISESFFQEGRNLKGILWFIRVLKYTENLSTVSYHLWPPKIDNRA